VIDDKKESFFARWSRLKKTAVAENPAPVPASPAPADLPSIDSLTPESDFSAFFRAKVEEKLRRAALKKMFQDPHFNVMDGLDVYIDDYSVPDPIPEAMLSRLEHVKEMLAPKDEPEKDEKKVANADKPALEPPAEIDAEREQNKA
jgi:hypothetical protein